MKRRTSCRHAGTSLAVHSGALACTAGPFLDDDTDPRYGSAALRGVVAIDASITTHQR